MTEAELRDLLATQISVLEEGLEVLDKEHYIPNELGTRSFLDLYARDSRGHHVLIEIKKSDAAAREAIHEIHKYAEGVKQHLGARENEIVVLVVSTEWRELLVPFSRLLSDTTLTIRGFKVSLDVSSSRLSAEPVTPLPVSYGRYIAPWHEVHWYLSENALEKGIKSIEASFAAKGIFDYVVAVLRPPEPCSSDHEEGMISTILQIAAMQQVDVNRPIPTLPTYEFQAYVAIQMLSDEEYLQILQKDKGALEEVNEYLNPESGEERLLQLHEAVGAMNPRPDSDHLEIGYPAKFTKFIDDREFEIIELRRSGLFARNELLQDESILSELRGEDGTTGQRFRRTITMGNRSHIASARRELASCLSQNPAWNSHIARALDEIEREFPSSEVDISVYNPSTGILTPYFTTSRDDGLLYLPTYSLIVRSPDPCRMYFGALESIRPSSSLRSILKKYYDNDLGALILTMTWGGRESRDVDIIEDMGASYRSFRCDIDGENRVVYALRDDRWRNCATKTIIDFWEEFLEQNEKLVRELLVKVGSRDMGTHFESPNSQLLIQEEIDIPRGESESIYRSINPMACSACGCSMAEEDYVIDALSDEEDLTSMCADCFILFRERIDIEVESIYQQRSGAWLRVGGGR